MANRPVVLVYQEYASVSVPAATPELTACIVGPAYQIVDYPEDSRSVDANGNVSPNLAGTYGALNAGTLAPVANLDLTYTGLKAGATVDQASVVVWAENVRGLVKRYTARTATQQSTTVDVGEDAAGAGIRVGDWCTLTDGNGKVLLRKVWKLAGTVVTFTSEFPATSATWTNGAAIIAQFERDLGTLKLGAGSVTPAATKATVTAGFQLGGLTVLYAELYVAYRALRADLAKVNTLSSFKLSSSGELGDVGKLDARNPLAAALYVASKNTNTSLQYYGVVSDDAVGYTEAKSSLSGRKDTYAVALCSSDPSVAASFGADFLSSADPQYALTNGVAQKFRMAIGSLGALPTTMTLVAKRTSTAAPLAGSVRDTGATFVDSGVIVGDLIRFYKGDGTTDDRAITAVSSNESVTYSATGGAPTSSDYDVVRDVSKNKDAQVDALTKRVGSGNRRLVLCWPDLVDVTDLRDGSKARQADGSKALADAQPGFYVGAGVAAMIAALPSHQGLTNLAVNGIKRAYHTNPHFTDRQLTKLSNAGVLVVTQDDENAPAYIVHELTTDVSTVEFSEIMCVKNMDWVSIAFRDVVDDFLGTWNLNEDTLSFLQITLETKAAGIIADKRPKIGARLKAAAVTQVKISDTQADRAELYLEGDFPKPLNTIGLHIVSS